MNMVSKCGPQILACVSDPTCKAALDCLQACDPTDQASSTQLLTLTPSQVICAMDSCCCFRRRCACRRVMTNSSAGVLISVHCVERDGEARGLHPLRATGDLHCRHGPLCSACHDSVSTKRADALLLRLFGRKTTAWVSAPRSQHGPACSPCQGGAAGLLTGRLQRTSSLAGSNQAAPTSQGSLPAQHI